MATVNNAEWSTELCLKFEADVHTHLGDRVLVVGSHVALGSWKPSAGIDLHTGPRTYPRWVGHIDIRVLAGETIEYKFVILQPCGNVMWEPGSNRVISGSREHILRKTIVSKRVSSEHTSPASRCTLDEEGFGFNPEDSASEEASEETFPTTTTADRAMELSGLACGFRLQGSEQLCRNLHASFSDYAGMVAEADAEKPCPSPSQDHGVVEHVVGKEVEDSRRPTVYLGLASVCRSVFRQGMRKPQVIALLILHMLAVAAGLRRNRIW